jgi:hypothetical protein
MPNINAQQGIHGLEWIKPMNYKQNMNAFYVSISLNCHLSENDGMIFHAITTTLVNEHHIWCTSNCTQHTSHYMQCISHYTQFALHHIAFTWYQWKVISFQVFALNLVHVKFNLIFMYVNGVDYSFSFIINCKNLLERWKFRIT